ncbi:MAG: LysE family transporter [Parvularculaceae bacterium]
MPPHSGCFSRALVQSAAGSGYGVHTRLGVARRRAGRVGRRSGALGWSLVWALLTAVGLAALLEASQAAYAVLRMVGGLYLLYLAWRAFKT